MEQITPNSISYATALYEGPFSLSYIDQNFLTSVIQQYRNKGKISYKQELALYKICYKYQKELAQLELDPDNIEEPIEEIQRNSITVNDKGNFIIKFKFDKKILNDIQSLEKRRFDAEEKEWIVIKTPKNVPLILSLVPKYGFDINEDLLNTLLREFGQEVLNEEIRENQRIENERMQDNEFDALEIEGLNGTLKNYQKLGVAYATMNQRIILGDEQGLGKTIQAISVIQYNQLYPAVIFCPASLQLNWRNEIKKFLPNKTWSIIGRKDFDEDSDFIICPYSKATRSQYQNILKSIAFEAAICDESHYLKSKKTQRNNAIKDLTKQLDWIILLSGTMITNRPAELAPQLEIIGRLDELGGWYKFMKRYCKAEQTSFGLKANGADNLQELHEKLRKICYIRRNKKDVLKELPDKTKTIIEIEIDNQKEYQFALDDLQAYLEKDLPAAEHLIQIEVLKQICVKGKLSYIKEWITDFLQSGEKLVVFATHKNVIQQLVDHFKCLRITGEDRDDAKQIAVDKFQNDPNENLIICNFIAGGVGHTLTAASNVAHIELGWNPATHSQGTDRCHRIGQKNAVTEWYILGTKTIDMDIYTLIQEKEKIINGVNAGIFEKKLESSILKQLIERIKTRNFTK